jgi:CBS-domain-containing membrane protein
VRLREVMTPDVWTVRADTLASVAGTTMLDHGYGCLPVVDGTHRLIGIVTAHDLLRLAVKTLRMHDTTRTEIPRELQLLAS